MFNKLPILVTGLGQISSIGQGIPKYEKILRKGSSQFIRTSKFPELKFPVIAALLKDFSFEETLNSFSNLPSSLLTRARKAGHRAPLTIQTSLIAALEAWEQARLHQRITEKNRLGIVIAGHNTMQSYQYQKLLENNLNYLSPNYALRFMDTDQVGTLSEVFEIKGEGLTVGGASASGNLAIIQAYRMIQQGFVDICMVIGVLADLSPLELQGFYNIGALGGRSFEYSPEKACRPFDKNREGFIWGQASGCMILESHTSQLPDKKSLAEIKSVSMILDGNRSSNPSVEGEIRVMEQVLMNTKLSPKSIRYINTHGTSSVLGDEVEIAAIRQVFKENINSLRLNSTKSILGHCLWSAGIMEAIACIIQIQNHFLHPNLNLENPLVNDCHFVGSQSEDINVQYAMSNSFGFGGINTSIVFEKGE